METNTPVFPVLSLSRDGSIVPYDDEESLTSCNARAFWRNRYYDDMLVFDADSRAWRVREVSVLSPPDGLARTFARLTNGPLRVTLTWSREPDRDGMDHARTQTEAWLKRDETFWEASADLQDWIGRVRGSTTIEEMLSIFR